MLQQLIDTFIYLAVPDNTSAEGGSDSDVQTSRTRE